MPTNIYWIYKHENSARLGIMARPRGDAWLEDEIVHIKKNEVHVLVSLLEKVEIRELSLEKEAYICNTKNITYINFPIPDRSIPQEEKDADRLIDILKKNLDEGLSVVIHCRMGIGRSSIIAGAVLLKYKLKASEIITLISSLRGLKVPDTDQQISWLKSRQ